MNCFERHPFHVIYKVFFEKNIKKNNGVYELYSWGKGRYVIQKIIHRQNVFIYVFSIL